jgi:hypothetical protein
MKTKKVKTKKTTYFNFTLVLRGVNEKTEGLEDALFEAGCDDALINFRNGTVYLDFDRESGNLEEAVISAIKQVESLPFGIIVASVSPDDYVSESEVAKRLHVNRQAVSLWFKGERHATDPFPPPIMKLNEKSPLWRWSDIVEWLYQKRKITDHEILEQAKFIGSLNIALMGRDAESKQLQTRIQKKLKMG